MSAAEPHNGDRMDSESLPSARRSRPNGDAGAGTKTRAQTAADKRRAILDAGVRVFARQGFHACRVADVADEAGVA
jgi:AcrR family transcriptional regulator